MASEDSPFGRQPEPVKVTLQGDLRDVDYYMRRIMSFIDNPHGDSAVKTGSNDFTIYPRAVNN